MKKLVLIATIFVIVQLHFAKEIILSGYQESTIQYRLEQNIEPFDGIDILMVSFVVPRNFTSPTYNQTISNLQFDFDPAPREQEQEVDKQGNQVRKFYWDAPQEKVRCTISLQANNRVELSSVKSQAKFPANISKEFDLFLKATDQVQSDNAIIQKKAKEITQNAKTELEAVKAVLHYVVDRMKYILVPDQYDALYALKTGKGNCQNYSHLSAALMRAVGIPVRIVNGITLKKPYDVEAENAEYSFDMAQGRHSWIEVYFPDIGWLPFDPQQTEFFVSNRYLRIEVGLDNEEAVQDGLVRWTQTHGGEEQLPKLEEAIESEFVSDKVKFRAEKTVAGPRGLLLTPALLTEVTPGEKPQPIEQPEPEEKPQEPIPEEIDYTQLTYDKPFESGNLEYPRNFDFLYARLKGSEGSSKKNELKRNFIVETAEYVTSHNQYAQTFILDEPIILKKIGLALHNFGGSGSLWLELSEDQEGRPGQTAVTSRRKPVKQIPIAKGYDWVDFDFSGEGILLTPGRYWFTLNYSGSPIINWFYSYGKPVGPVDGTRSRKSQQAEWNKILNFEFNYRVVGLGAE